jgi:L-threonylcarbamoyladenylate synthase
MNAISTRRLRASQAEDIALAAEMLRRGELVVFPTDTVYGVGTSPWSEDAIARLFAVKGRHTEKAIPILLADGADLAQVTESVPDAAAQLIARFWPGPLTLIVPKGGGLPANISHNNGIAVRMPDHDAARAIIRAAGGAVATTSANRSGAPAARSAAEALATFDGRVAAVVDGGAAPLAHASTIVDCRTIPHQILRQGPLDAATLAQVRQIK